MIRALAGLVTILAALSQSQAMAAETQAASPCGNAKDVIGALQERYHEKPTFSGVLQTGNPFTVTVAPNGTWTFLVVRQDGQICAIAAGGAWQPVASPAPKTSPGSLPDAPALLRNGLLLIGY